MEEQSEFWGVRLHRWLWTPYCGRGHLGLLGLVFSLSYFALGLSLSPEFESAERVWQRIDEVGVLMVANEDQRRSRMDVLLMGLRVAVQQQREQGEAFIQAAEERQKQFEDRQAQWLGLLEGAFPQIQLERRLQALEARASSSHEPP
mgnify:CR=1 FL=1